MPNSLVTTTTARLFTSILTLSALCAAQASAGELSGRVVIDKKLHAKIAPTAALYVIARTRGATSGPPLAVKRFAYPLEKEIQFTLSQADSMMPEIKLEGKVSVTARVAQSGSAIPVAHGDLVVAKPVEAEVGKSKNLKLVVDQVHAGSPPAPQTQ